jgi:hypothetical protein
MKAISKGGLVLAGALALCITAPAVLAQAAKGTVTNPAAGKARQMDPEDDKMSGRKTASKKGGSQSTVQGPAQGPQGQRNMKSQATVQGPAQGPQGQRKGAIKGEMHKGEMHKGAAAKMK